MPSDWSHYAEVDIPNIGVINVYVANRSQLHPNYPADPWGRILIDSRDIVTVPPKAADPSHWIHLVALPTGGLAILKVINR